MSRMLVRGAVAGLVMLGAACAASPPPVAVSDPSTPAAGPIPSGRPDDPERRVVTLALAGDVHFQLHLASLLDDRRGLGPMARVLAGADVSMVNLESAITDRGAPDPKALEDPGQRYWFRAPARALDVLAEAGVDVVTVANNHGADYGEVGLRDTLRAAHTGPVAVVGVGRDRRAAFAAHRVTVRDTDLAFLAADASPLESTTPAWRAGRRTPGLAAAHEPRPEALLDAVRRLSDQVDVVVVYLHWGAELQTCATAGQRALARRLAAAGADVVVGSHAHVLLGSGWRGSTYVNYGLGNFVWYHDQQPDTGVLRLRIEDGEVRSDRWVPARIGVDGVPSPLLGAPAARATAEWRALRRCSDLAPDRR